MSTESELKGLLAVAEHRLKAAEIRAEHAERNWAQTLESFYESEAARQRVWNDLVPDETKRRIEHEQLMEKKRQDEQSANLIRLLSGEDET